MLNPHQDHQHPPDEQGGQELITPDPPSIKLIAGLFEKWINIKLQLKLWCLGYLCGQGRDVEEDADLGAHVLTLSLVVQYSELTFSYPILETVRLILPPKMLPLSSTLFH